MEKILSAEEFLDEYIKKESIPWNQDIEKLYGAINIAMIEFAKLHVKAGLLKASEKAEAYNIDEAGQTIYTDAKIDKESILNSYPLNLIK